MLPDRPLLTLITSARVRFRLNSRIELRNVDHDAAVSAIADRFLLVRASTRNVRVRLSTLMSSAVALRACRRRRREMPDVEVDAEVLMARRQQLSTAIEFAAASMRLISTGVARTAIRPEPTRGAVCSGPTIKLAVPLRPGLSPERSSIGILVRIEQSVVEHVTDRAAFRQQDGARAFAARGPDM